MSKLWIYGCSFSEPFGLGGEAIVYKDGTREFCGAEYWGTHLANKLNVEVINKALSGIGWNYIVTQIDSDILSWDKKDLIIISPSFFSRATIMEFIEWDISPKVLDYCKTFTEIVEYNKSRWLAKIRTLQYFGYNVYTWVVDENANDITDLRNLILTPDSDINWRDWMDRNKEFWLDTDNNDWHFNAKGHIEVANRMYNIIKDKI